MEPEPLGILDSVPLNQMSNFGLRESNIKYLSFKSEPSATWPLNCWVHECWDSRISRFLHTVKMIFIIYIPSISITIVSGLFTLTRSPNPKQVYRGSDSKYLPHQIIIFSSLSTCCTNHTVQKVSKAQIWMKTPGSERKEPLKIQGRLWMLHQATPASIADLHCKQPRACQIKVKYWRLRQKTEQQHRTVPGLHSGRRRSSTGAILSQLEWNNR